MSAAKVPAHVQRMVEERDQLAERLTKLSAFTETKTFADLDEQDQNLLHSQASLMGSYRDILNIRIDRASA